MEGRREARPDGVLPELNAKNGGGGGGEGGINTSETVFILNFDIFVHHVNFALIFIF